MFDAEIPAVSRIPDEAVAANIQSRWLAARLRMPAVSAIDALSILARYREIHSAC